MWTVEKFLCCLQLSTGGYVLGILGAITNSISAIFVAIALIYAMIDYPGMIENLQKLEIDLSTVQGLLESQKVLIACLMIFLVIICFTVYASVLLILGTKYKLAHKLKPYMGLMIFSMIFACLQLFQFTFNAVVSVALNTLVNGYLYVCIYSLYLKIRGENESILDTKSEKQLP